MVEDKKENTEINNEMVIEIANISVSFANQSVLKNISLSLKKGENLVIFGQSGCGKSVLIKCIARLLLPDSGTIKILGHTIGNNSKKEEMEIRKKIGFLFQSGALYDSMSVKENLEFSLKRSGKNNSQQEVDKKIKEAIENVGLPNVLDKMPSELSGGMKKRVALSRTIIADPLIMLYDEPTTGLDPITSKEISELINKVKELYNTSSIIITHDISCARKVADRAIFLRNGSIYAEGTLQQLENSTDLWVRSFFE